MSVYNSEKYLEKAIESILNQTYTNFEFLIIDDGSTGSISDILHKYGDPRIRLVKNENNLGLTKSLNKGLALANGEYIARMDADDISLPKRFEKQVSFLIKNPDIALVGTSNYIIDSQGTEIGSRIVPASVDFNDLLKENPFNHGSIMVKKSVLISMGGYNEFFRYAQDYELWLRIAKLYPVRNLIEPLYKQRVHTENIGHVNTEEAVLYRIFAVKLNNENAEKKTIDLIKNNGIKSLIPNLTKNETIFYYDSIADMYIRNGDNEKGKEQYMKIFHLSPFNFLNNFMLIRSYLVIHLNFKRHRVTQILLNLISQIKKGLSK